MGAQMFNKIGNFGNNLCNNEHYNAKNWTKLDNFSSFEIDAMSMLACCSDAEDEKAGWWAGLSTGARIGIYIAISIGLSLLCL